MEASLPRALRRTIADQRVRFLAVGGVNTLVGYALYAILAEWVFADIFLGYLIALAVSYAISITLAFFLYRRFVFVVKGNVFVDFVRFVSVYAVSILANVAALPVLVEFVGFDPLIAQAIVLVITVVISFVGHKYFSFRRRAESEPAESNSSPAAPRPSADLSPDPGDERSINDG